MIKISIIIYIYNSEKYLESSLDSILKQGLDSIEIICINDNLNDTSLDILKKYQQKYNNIIIINQKNNNMALTKNTAIELAKGKYIYFFEVGNLMNTDMLERCYETLESNNLDIAMFDCKIYLQNNENKSIYIDRYECLGRKIYNGKQILNIIEILNSINVLNTTTQIYRKKFILEENIKFYNNIASEDIYYALESILKANRVKHVGGILLDQMSKEFNNNINKELILNSINKIVKIDCELNLSENNRVILFYYIKYYIKLNEYYENKYKKNIKEILKNNGLLDIELSILLDMPMIYLKGVYTNE